MQFLRQSPQQAQNALAKTLLRYLDDGKTVLWLIPGGSNILTAATVMAQLLGHEDKLLITLSDERYGRVGHADSNWQQLLSSGFEPGNAIIYPVLQHGLNLAETAEQFNLKLVEYITRADVLVGHLGMGADGHIAGILPRSTATLENQSLATAYFTEQFERVTTTFRLLEQLDYVYCLVYGSNKKVALENLKSQNLSLEIQPAQILKSIRQAYVYNDQVGDN